MSNTEIKTTPGVITTGYKATDADMRCRGYQFELGVWHEHHGEVVPCASGFHFCEYPSGPWCYYSDPGTRIFKVEAEGAVLCEDAPGADRKLVAPRIRLIEEVAVGGDCNTGDGNTGDRNTGDGNTGDGNTGDRNTGDGNTGHCNTGYRNTGYGNTGYRNTGDCNTGDRNTGHCNTGYRNTGDCNTGHCNTGDGNTGYGNTGYGNATSFSAGFFASREPHVESFDDPTGLTCSQFLDKYPNTADLAVALTKDAPIEFERFSNIPGITPEKLAALHALHIADRGGSK